MKRLHARTGPAPAFAALLVATLAAPPAHAVNPLEYPDNGAAQFSRGGAWLATATDPIAVHYNPAALAAQPTAFSIDARLNYAEVCFDRTNEDNQPTGPVDRAPFDHLRYREVCNNREAFPMAIPAIALAWRATDRLGIGVALVPPSAYGTANEAWPALAPVLNTDTGEEQLAPAPYRYMTTGNQSTIIFPTASIGYELGGGFRVGAGFISGIAVINTSTAGISSVNSDFAFDDATVDSSSTLRTEDLFMPGGILSIHWSVTDHIDVAAWGRFVDSVRSTTGDLRTRTNFYNRATLGSVNPKCDAFVTTCSNAIENVFDDNDFVQFEFPFPPPEVRVGVRFHQPRSLASKQVPFEYRDPLHDDVFDLEVNGSYTWNSTADEITVRFFELANGQGRPIVPTGFLPPIADRATGFKDSWGVRFGGQYNAVQDKFGIMAGTWVETESQDPELMSVSPPGPLRGGIGGGLVLRQQFIDFMFGYQFHWSGEFDNNGEGRFRAVAGVEQGPGNGFSVNDEPRNLPAVERQEFRSFHTVNNGSITVQAHVFALGGVVRF